VTEELAAAETGQARQPLARRTGTGIRDGHAAFDLHDKYLRPGGAHGRAHELECLQ
jgi:hypothetical protein